MEPTTPTSERPGTGQGTASPAAKGERPSAIVIEPGMGRLLARQAVPHYATGCLVAAAAVANAAGELSGEAATAAAATVGTLFVIAVLLACKKGVRLRLTAVAAECGRMWLGAVAVGAAAWVALRGDGRCAGRGGPGAAAPGDDQLHGGSGVDPSRRHCADADRADSDGRAATGPGGSEYRSAAVNRIGFARCPHSAAARTNGSGSVNSA